MREHNPNFTGRDEVLAQVDKTLAAGKRAAVVQAITGLGGVGKTQVAIEYVHRYGSHYEVVWRLGAEMPATLVGDMAQLASALRLKAAPGDVVDSVRRWLDGHNSWLLVFDNATDPTEVYPYLPERSGNIIITSRHPAWRQRADVVSVDVWSADESIEFLCKRTKRTNRQDQSGAAAVAALLGHLPLALEQAAAFMEVRGTSFAGYVKLFTRVGSGKLLRSYPPSSLGYQASVASTWNLSFQQVRLASTAAAELLEVSAFLAPDIPEALLEQHALGLIPSMKDAATNKLELEESLGLLYRYSLIDRNRQPGHVSIHRLVQEVIRLGLPDEVRRQRIATCLTMLTSAFPLGDATMRDCAICDTLLPHVFAVVPHATAIGCEPGTTRDLLLRAGKYMGRRAQREGVRRSLEHANAVAEAAYGEHNPEVANCLEMIGDVLTDLSDLTAARACFERAIAITDKVYGKDSGQLVPLLNKLALVLREMGDPGKAKTYLVRALEIQQGR